MKNKKIIATILLTTSTLVFTACGNAAPSASKEETEKDQVVENIITEESETAIEETVENNLKIEINSGSLTSDLKEYEAKFITYEAIEPTTMYAVTYSEIYPDLNASEGVLRVDGCVEVGDEVIIDGKGFYNDVEYYRIKHSDTSMNPYQSIVPATALSFEKPVGQQSAPAEKMENQ